MQIQVNTDDHIEGREALIHWVEAEVRHILNRFSEQITRIEVHLRDEDSNKSGGNDKRCLMEARLPARQPIAVSHHGGSLHEALSGATGKLKHALESTLGRLKDHHGRDTIRSPENAADPQSGETADPAAAGV